MNNIGTIRGAGFALIMGLVLVIVIIYTVIKLRKQVKEKEVPQNKTSKYNPEKKEALKKPGKEE